MRECRLLGPPSFVEPVLEYLHNTEVSVKWHFKLAPGEIRLLTVSSLISMVEEIRDLGARRLCLCSVGGVPRIVRKVVIVSMETEGVALVTQLPE